MAVAQGTTLAEGDILTVGANGNFDKSELNLSELNSITSDVNELKTLTSDQTKGNEALYNRIDILNTALDDKANSSDVYTKTEVDAKLGAKVDTSTVNTMTTDINDLKTLTSDAVKGNQALSNRIDTINTSLAAKANQSDLSALNTQVGTLSQASGDVSIAYSNNAYTTTINSGAVTKNMLAKGDTVTLNDGELVTVDGAGFKTIPLADIISNSPMQVNDSLNVNGKLNVNGETIFL